MFKLAAVFSLLASSTLAAGLEIQIEGEANGTVKIDLFEDLAPKHVEQITALAAAGKYDGVVFHRVIDGFMAQMGGSDLADLPAEFSERPFDRGIVGMARSQNPNSANSQFFIMFKPGHFLNGQYTVVGQVTEGMDVVDAIKLGTGGNGSVVGKPDMMSKVTVTE